MVVLLIVSAISSPSPIASGLLTESTKSLRRLKKPESRQIVVQRTTTSLTLESYRTSPEVKLQVE